jgi:hypothetical protein
MMRITGPHQSARCLSRRGRHVGGPRNRCFSGLCQTGWVTPSGRGCLLNGRWDGDCHRPSSGGGDMAGKSNFMPRTVRKGRLWHWRQARRRETRIHCSRDNIALAARGTLRPAGSATERLCPDGSWSFPRPPKANAPLRPTRATGLTPRMPDRSILFASSPLKHSFAVRTLPPRWRP